MNEGPFEIVLVEDNPADAYLFRKALEHAGLNFRLMVIEDGSEALAFVRREGKYAETTPDLMVLDLNLPKSDGIEVLEAIRRSDLAAMPVVIATSSASPSDRAKAEQLSIERYITKPPDLESFLRIGFLLKEILLKRRPS